MLLNPDKIAEATRVPIITIPANHRMTKLYSILIPITDFFPGQETGVWNVCRFGV